MSDEKPQHSRVDQSSQPGALRRTIAFTCRACDSRISVGAQYAGRKGKCQNCGALLTIPTHNELEESGGPQRAVCHAAVPAPPTSLRAPSGAVPPPKPPTPPSANEIPPHTTYADLPWYRRGGVLSWFAAAALVTWLFGYGTIPCIPVCIALLTGDVYYSRHTPDGSLKKWGWPNKAAAYVLLLLNIFPIASALLSR